MQLIQIDVLIRTSSTASTKNQPKEKTSVLLKPKGKTAFKELKKEIAIMNYE